MYNTLTGWKRDTTVAQLMRVTARLPMLRAQINNATGLDKARLECIEQDYLLLQAELRATVSNVA